MVILFSIIRGLIVLTSIFGAYSFFRNFKTNDKKQQIKNIGILIGIIIIIWLPISSSLSDKEKKEINVKFVINAIYGQQVIKDQPLIKKEMLKK